MAIRTTYTRTVSDGDQLDQGYFNPIAGTAQIIDSIYDGSDFNSSQSGSAGTDTANHTIQISSSDIGALNYIVINVSYSAVATVDAVGSGTVKIKIERQETDSGAGFSTIVDEQTVQYKTNAKDDAQIGDHGNSSATLTVVLALTADEKTNGVDIKFTSTSVVVGNETASFTNIQTWFTGLN